MVATEDKRFYWHLGISPRGIASAIRINLAEGRGPLEGNGGSTITQQVAKLLCLGVPYDPTQWKSEADYEQDCRGGGMWRKIKEVPYSMAMEVKYSKEDILTIYFNRAYLGAGARGFEAAAQRYFGKSAANVTPAEAAMLAGLLKAPSTYAPTGNMERARDRAAVVIGLMEDQGYLTAGRGRRSPRPSGRTERGRQAEIRRLLCRLGDGDDARLSGARHHRRRDHRDHAGPADAGAGRRGAGLGVRQQGQGRLERAGRDCGDECGWRRARDGGRAQYPAGGRFQPRHTGAAADRIGVQALHLCRGDGSGLFAAGLCRGCALVDLRPRIGRCMRQRITTASSRA